MPANSSAGDQLGVRVSRTHLATQSQRAYPTADSHIGQIKYDQPPRRQRSRQPQFRLRRRVLPCRRTRDRSSLLQIDTEDKSPATNDSN